MSESYLDIRANLLAVAATLDRIDRGNGDLPTDSQQDRQRIDAAIQILLSKADDRAADLQQLFSLPYDPQWPSRLNVPLGAAASDSGSSAADSDSSGHVVAPEQN